MQSPLRRVGCGSVRAPDAGARFSSPSRPTIYWRSRRDRVDTAPGHALPTGRCPSARMGDIDEQPRQAGHAAGSSRILLRPTRQAPRLAARKPASRRRSAARTAPRSARRRLKEAIDRTREVLEVPADFLIGIVPASDTGAVEMAMWSMLGPRPVQVLAWESFCKDWVTDVVEQLKLPNAEVLDAPLRPAAGPDQGAPGRRPGVHLERHHLGRARAERRLHRRRPQGHHHLRRHQRRLRPGRSIGPSSMW